MKGWPLFLAFLAASSINSTAFGKTLRTVGVDHRPSSGVMSSQGTPGDIDPHPRVPNSFVIDREGGESQPGQPHSTRVAGHPHWFYITYPNLGFASFSGPTIVIVDVDPILQRRGKQDR